MDDNFSFQRQLPPSASFSLQIVHVRGFVSRDLAMTEETSYRSHFPFLFLVLPYSEHSSPLHLLVSHPLGLVFFCFFGTGEGSVEDKSCSCSSVREFVVSFEAVTFSKKDN